MRQPSIRFRSATRRLSVAGCAVVVATAFSEGCSTDESSDSLGAGGAAAGAAGAGGGTAGSGTAGSAGKGDGGTAGSAGHGGTAGGSGSAGSSGSADGPLLTGVTPSTFSVPTGWTLVRTQDFESGAVASDESVNGSITTEVAHGGQRALQGRVWKDDCATGWTLKQGTATTGELYLSWYEYMDPHGRMNDEMWLMSIRKDWPDHGWTFQTERWQWLNHLGEWSTAFNITDGNLVFFCEGTETGTTGSVCYYDEGVWRTVGFGLWQQWEVYWKTNTADQPDGVTRIFLNGNKITEVVNKAYSGSIDMTGPRVTLGGEVYTKIDWGSTPTGPCAETVQEISNSISRPDDFAEPCVCPSQCPPDGYVPIFYRYVDDIIVLQR